MLAITTYAATAVLLFHTPTKFGSDRFRQIFIDHWEKWWDYRREEIPADQRAYVQKTGTITEICEILGISKPTLYAYLAQRNETK